MEDLGTLVDDLEPGAVRSGAITRLRLRIVEDGAGLPVALPVLIARGELEGPTLGIIAAVHGNEINGIPVIHRVFERLEPRRLRGTVVGVLVVNYPSFSRQVRRYLDGVDLNHIMPGDPAGNASRLYAYRVKERVLSKFDYLVDLHTASVGRHNTLYARADLEHEACATMASLLRPQIILHNQPNDGTVRGTAAHLGIPAVTLEIGNPLRFQPEHIRRCVSGIRAVMRYLDMIKSKSKSRRETPDPIFCERSYWTYTDRGGLLTVHPGLGERVAAGSPIATLTNVFGDVTRTYEAPEDGVVIGRAVNPVGYSGARIVHLGVEFQGRARSAGSED